MKLTAEHLEGFSKVLAGRYDSPKPIPEFHREMWRMCCSQHPQVAIAAPRFFAKSTAITFAYVLANLLFRNHRHVLILSSNEELASGFLGDIRIELQENDALIDTFKIQKFRKESETEIIVELVDGYKFRVVAKGAGQRMRGLKWDRMRPDLVVGDDLEDDETVLNQERRNKFKRWFYGAVVPIVNDGGLIRMVGTIVHQDSLLENFMPDLKAKSTVITPLKTYSTRKNPPWLAAKYRAHDSADPRQASHWLWPEQKSPDELCRMYEDYKDRGIADLYGQEMLNEPLDESTVFFKEEWFKTSPMTEEWSRRSKEYYASIDFAISQDQWGDYTAINVVAIDDQNRLELVHARKGRWDSLEIIDNMFQIHKRFHPKLFITERGSIERAIGPFLKAEMKNRGIYLNLYPIVPTKDKIKRARAIQGRMRMGDVFFDKNTDWYADFHEEMKRFPRAKHEDYVDAFAWLGQGLDLMVTAPTLEEVDEERREELRQERQDAWRDMGLGVNSVTGY